MKKELAIVGLGKMGANMARRMAEQNWKVVGWNRTYEVAEALAPEGVTPVKNYAEMVNRLSPRRIVWLMLPAGSPVDEALFGADGIAQQLLEGDIVIDGGNSFYKDAKPRAEKLTVKGIHYMDVGTSGGPGGARNGACLMIGGERKLFEEIKPLFKDFARESAYQFFEGHGAGHFVKMVHNGIEYGMMQAIAEGFEVMKKSDYQLNLTKVSDIYNHGSVVESRLIGWLENAFKQYGEDLKEISSIVGHTGEGEWTVKTAEELGVTVPVIKDSYQFRVESEKNPRFAGKVLSALRNQFGGHSTK